MYVHVHMYVCIITTVVGSNCRRKNVDGQNEEQQLTVLEGTEATFSGSYTSLH